MCIASEANSSGLPEPVRERNRGGERILRLLRQAAEQRRQEQAGRDGEHTDAELRKLARDRQGHADDAALRGRIGGLPDLAVIGRDRSGVDHDAALAACKRLQLRHRRCRKPQHVEGADQVDLDNPLEIGKRVRRVAADHALGNTDAGAIDQHARRAVRLGGLRDGSLRRGGIGDVAGDGHALELGRDALGELGVEVEHRDLRALRRQLSRGRGAEARCSTGDDRGLILQLHDVLPEFILKSVMTRADGVAA